VRVNDAVIGVIVVLFALAMVWHTRSFPSMPGQDYGPAPFPARIGIGMIISGGILIAGGLARRPLRLRHGEERVSDRAGDPRHRARALVEDNFMTTMIKSNGAPARLLLAPDRGRARRDHARDLDLVDHRLDLARLARAAARARRGERRLSARATSPAD
jgi:hypothetical protein